VAGAAVGAAGAAVEVVVGSVGAAAAVAAAAGAAMANGDRPEVRDEYHTNVIGVPRILLGDYLAQSRAMFLANVYLRLSQCSASRQTFICAADRFNCSRR
jgi:hypothetical protein